MYCSLCDEIIDQDDVLSDDLCDACFQMINGGVVEESYFLNEDDEESIIL